MKLKQIFCRHKFEIEKIEQIGYDLGWSFKLQAEYKHTYKCSKCGKIKEENYLRFGDKTYNNFDEIKNS